MNDKNDIQHFDGDSMTASEETLRLVNTPIVQAFIEKFPLPVAIAVNEEIHMANAAYAELTGFASADDMLGKHVSVFIHPSDLERFLSVNRNRHSGLVSGQSYRWKYLVNGQTKIVEGHPTIFSIGSDTILVSTIVDITDSLRREEALEQERQSLLDQNKRLVSRLGMSADICVSDSPAMRRIMEQAFRLAGSDANIVILGETGCGKSMLANIIHDLSPRCSKSFVVVNCAAIPENLLESEFFGHVRGAFTGASRNRDGYLAEADGGTLFLDEVGELSPAMQAKLLHAVERKKFIPVGGTKEVAADCRLVCATNRDLKEMVRTGQLREDFFYRIFVADLRIPPLRERRSDISPLVDFFLAKFGMKEKCRDLPSRVFGRLMSYSWPGNVRELQNVVLRYAATGELRFLNEEERGEEFSEQIPAPDEDLNLALYMEKAERNCILAAIRACGGRKDRAAAKLGVNLRTFHRRCAKLGIFLKDRE